MQDELVSLCFMCFKFCIVYAVVVACVISCGRVADRIHGVKWKGLLADIVRNPQTAAKYKSARMACFVAAGFLAYMLIRG